MNTIDENTTGSTDGNVGSPKDQTQAPDKGQASADQKVDWEKQYKDLETKLGSQGEELGKYRSYLSNIDPLLKTLEQQPELIQAIMDGKINSDLAKAAIEGKLTMQEAKDVTKAHEEVKKELGKKEYDKASPEDIEKHVLEKLEDYKSTIDKRLADNEEIREFEKNIDDFVKNTPDFSDYADKINEYFEKNSDKDDLEAAYYIVKGQVLSKKSKEEEDKKATEATKNLVPKGGASYSKDSPEFRDILRKVISPIANPNNF